MSKPLDVLLITPPSRVQVYQELSRDFAAIGVNFVKKKCARPHPVDVKITSTFQCEVCKNKRGTDAAKNNNDQHDKLIIARR